MKSLILALCLSLSFTVFSQVTSDKTQIETTLNNYIDAFYKGDTVKLKAAIKPRLNKFGYWKNTESGNYEYYAHMSYDKAMDFVQKMKDDGKTRDENKIRNVDVLDIGNHIASAKVTAIWGIDYVLLSKDEGKWMIEQVIWEGPYKKELEQKTTTYYLIRHAEKDRSDKTNRDPHLTKDGLKRADNWAKVLKDVKFDMVYSTDYNRTKETALPTAKANNVELKFYNPSDMQIEQFMEASKGKTVLVVGHSNTTPLFTNGLLGEKKHEMIADDNNANLYIVTVTKASRSSTVLVVD
jgi:broad specificity phosphatase PhoE